MIHQIFGSKNSKESQPKNQELNLKRLREKYASSSSSSF